MEINWEALNIQVCSGRYMQEIQQSLRELTNYNRFPGAQPVSFELKHIETLKTEKYFVCEKTDGVRLLLYTRYNNILKRYESFFLDRKLQPFYIPELKLYSLDMKESVNTLLDGELVIDRIPFKEYYKKQNRKIPKLEKEPEFKEIYRFLLFDCIYLSGEFMNQRTFDVRLGKCQGLLKSYHKMRTTMGLSVYFTLELKAMLPSYRLQEPLHIQTKNDDSDTSGKLKHESDGLIFTKWHNTLVFGTDHNILKWKPPHLNSVDFKVKVKVHSDILTDVEKIEFVLHIGLSDHKLKEIGVLRFDDFEVQTEFEINKDLYEGVIVECKLVGSMWMYMRLRDDKDIPNHISTYEKVMQSIQDNITKQVLLDLALDIKSNWEALQ